MKLTALIPIKECSIRLPNKNFLPFGAVPLYEVIIQKLQDSELIGKIVINTDSEIIKENCRCKFSKVELIDRPKHLLGNHITMNSIIEYDLQQIEGEHFLQTHCTNPLLQISTIENAVKKYFEQLEKFDSLITVDVIQKRGFDVQGNPINHSNATLLNTQDLDKIYIENSNLFIFSRTSFFESQNSRIGKNAFFYEMNSIESTDIDYQQDYLLALTVYNNKVLFGLKD